ncbi:MAG: hypothetical protein IPF48_13300 [Sphingomonadales bacterium]|nr:hypothetical protein [Sphingomonadales bacterium]
MTWAGCRTVAEKLALRRVEQIASDELAVVGNAYSIGQNEAVEVEGLHWWQSGSSLASHGGGHL